MKMKTRKVAIRPRKGLVAVTKDIRVNLFDLPAVYINKSFISGTTDGLVYLGLSDETDVGIKHRGNFIMTLDGLARIHQIMGMVLEQQKKG